ncbi:hypothetical protein VTN77DRAFT_8908 [Rasamsonia byssochlamydoides]|uniref:uncharacterized protein n=1 Tax=Rasamsonia byssochlamydoides TaxID=89139 RepID=UPI003743717F
MGPKRVGGGGGKPAKKPDSNRKKKASSHSHQNVQQQQQQQRQKRNDLDDDNDKEEIDLSTGTIPLTLQQLLLNVFRYGLLEQIQDGQQQQQEKELDIKSLIQTIKAHLYHRDFDSAFADADEDLLRAYALRWSAARALGYAGILKTVLRDGVFLRRRDDNDECDDVKDTVHVLCIGGGAGAEIVALAGMWRDMLDDEEEDEKEEEARSGDNPVDTDKDNVTTTLAAGVEDLSLNGGDDDNGGASTEDVEETEKRKEERPAHIPSPKRRRRLLPNLSVTAVDIADWSTVVARLSQTIHSSAVPGSKAHPSPLLPPLIEEGGEAGKGGGRGSSFSVSFKRLDVLSLTDDELRALLWRDSHTQAAAAAAAGTVLITLMFTLNELFATSMAKATQFLLRLTDLAAPGTILLVVDSPGSYSTVSLGGKKTNNNGDDSGSSTAGQRHYPMKFLLDHTLLSVAVGKWDRILSHDSRWFRRDATRLRYDVGEGARLEDMRYQIHVYRRLRD